jgi:hypothetical protein
MARSHWAITRPQRKAETPDEKNDGAPLRIDHFDESEAGAAPSQRTPDMQRTPVVSPAAHTGHAMRTLSCPVPSPPLPTPPLPTPPARRCRCRCHCGLTAATVATAIQSMTCREYYSAELWHSGLLHVSTRRHARGGAFYRQLQRLSAHEHVVVRLARRSSAERVDYVLHTLRSHARCSAGRTACTMAQSRLPPSRDPRHALIANTALMHHRTTRHRSHAAPALPRRLPRARS